MRTWTYSIHSYKLHTLCIYYLSYSECHVVACSGWEGDWSNFAMHPHPSLQHWCLLVAHSDVQFHCKQCLYVANPESNDNNDKLIDAHRITEMAGHFSSFHLYQVFVSIPIVVKLTVLVASVTSCCNSSSVKLTQHACTCTKCSSGDQGCMRECTMDMYTGDVEP